MIQIICNRCNKPIESIQKVGFIQFCYQNPFETVTDNNISDRNHYCEDCMTEIEQFVRNNLPKISVSAVDNAEKKTTPLLREKEFISEPRSNRYRIDYERIMSLRESGMKNKDIAVEMDMTSQEVATAVYTYKKRNGNAAESEREESEPKKLKEPKPKKSQEPQEQEEKIDVGKIKALWNAKWSISKIADEMDMAESEIIDVLDQG